MIVLIFSLIWEKRLKLLLPIQSNNWGVLEKNGPIQRINSFSRSVKIGACFSLGLSAADFDLKASFNKSQ